MKAVCIKKCQVNLDGKIHFVSLGEVRDIEEPHRCFRAIEDTATDKAETIDFLTASKAELQSTKWKVSEANAAIEAAFDVTLNNEKGTKKSDLVRQILDARYRAVNSSSFDKVAVD